MAFIDSVSINFVIDWLPNEIQLDKGVQQEDSLPQKLFSALLEGVFRKFHRKRRGIKIGRI